MAIVGLCLIESECFLPDQMPEVGLEPTTELVVITC